jgi:NAD(P)-dependent dehydrogenase (short-subunit alcohol dehydrogenase family)
MDCFMLTPPRVVDRADCRAGLSRASGSLADAASAAPALPKTGIAFIVPQAYPFVQQARGETRMDLHIENLKVLVTAGAGGIGLKIAEAFLREGASVHVCDIDAQAVGSLSQTHPALSASVCDVADRAQVAQLFEDALRRLGGLDCLVNNAGIAGPTGAVQEIDPQDWDRCLQVNLTGQFNCARLAIPHLTDGGGGQRNCSIMNLSSQAGRFGFAMRAPYAASKWGVIGFTKSLALELGPSGVRVNALLPGIVAGDRQRRVLEAKAAARGITFEEIERMAFSHTSIKEYVTAEQLADLVVYTASPHARTISGQSLSVCGDTNMLA